MRRSDAMKLRKRIFEGVARFVQFARPCYQRAFRIRFGFFTGLFVGFWAGTLLLGRVVEGFWLFFPLEFDDFWPSVLAIYTNVAAIFYSVMLACRFVFWLLRDVFPVLEDYRFFGDESE